MADQEIKKHTKNVLAIVAGESHGFWHKAREIVLEVVVIVFAVSMSIWLHGLGEHRHEQQQVKSFLLGLKADLRRDLGNIDAIVKEYHSFDANYLYLSKLDPASAPDQKAFDAAYDLAGRNIFFVPELSRYEGFKSSGKLDNMENQPLHDKIVGFYHDTTAKVGYSQGGWLSNQTKLRAYLDATLDAPDGADIRFKLITAPRGKRLCATMIAHQQLYERLHDASALAAQLITDIDRAYPDTN